MKWITREKVKVDRVACPWLIKKFVDKDAEFVFVPADKVAALARVVVTGIVAAPCRGDRLGQSVRNLFECLGLADEGRELSLRCGERPDSPLR